MLKLGDTVQLISNKFHSRNNIGDIGIITLDGNYEDRRTWYVQVPNGPDRFCWSYESDLKKIPKIRKLNSNIRIL
jgi:hypothetical protein